MLKPAPGLSPNPVVTHQLCDDGQVTPSVSYLVDPGPTGCGVRLYHLLPGKDGSSHAPQQWEARGSVTFSWFPFD